MVLQVVRPAVPPRRAAREGRRRATRRRPAKSFAYVSGYAAPISIFGLNLATGALTPAGMATTGMAGEPTSLAFSPDKRVPYAGDEQKDQPAARVIAFSINPATGALQEINRENTGGTTLAHVNVHPTGRWVLSANYGTGNVTVFPVRTDGGLGPAMPRVTAGGQAHYILFESTGKFLFVPCVQARHVALFRFADGVLTPTIRPPWRSTAPPATWRSRPDDRFAYVITQDSSTLYSFTLDKTTGRLTPLETVNATASSSLGAHVAVHPSGKFLYTSNRSDNSVSIFIIDSNTGRLTRVGYQRDNINYPWWLSVDPSRHLPVVANDRSATVVSDRIDPTTGTLQPIGMPLTVPMRPTYVGVLSFPDPQLFFAPSTPHAFSVSMLVLASGAICIGMRSPGRHGASEGSTFLIRRLAPGSPWVTRLPLPAVLVTSTTPVSGIERVREVGRLRGAG